MRKLFLIIPVIILFTLRAFPQAEISLDCPDSFGPGRFTRVNLVITFEETDGFARFTQELPVGFGVVKDEVPAGDFNWNGSQLNVVWMKIPDSKRISFSYFIRPDNQMNGMIDLGGKVVMVHGGDKKETVVLRERQISIGGTGGLLPSEMGKNAATQIVTNVTNDGGNLQTGQGAAANGTVYRVQFATSAKEVTGDAMMKKLGIVSDNKITVVKSGGIFKYQMGEFSDKGSAEKLKKQLVSKGINDAFIVTAR